MPLNSLSRTGMALSLSLIAFLCTFFGLTASLYGEQKPDVDRYELKSTLLEDGRFSGALTSNLTRNQFVDRTPFDFGSVSVKASKKSERGGKDGSVGGGNQASSVGVSDKSPSSYSTPVRLSLEFLMGVAVFATPGTIKRLDAGKPTVSDAMLTYIVGIPLMPAGIYWGGSIADIERDEGSLLWTYVGPVGGAIVGSLGAAVLGGLFRDTTDLHKVQIGVVIAGFAAGGMVGYEWSRPASNNSSEAKSQSEQATVSPYISPTAKGGISGGIVGRF